MSFYLYCIANYAKFTGRARRSEYWYFVLFNFIISVIASIIGALFGGQYGAELLSGLYALAVLVPSVAVGVRRLHDIGKSGWWLLISFIPFIGGIWLIILFCMDSQLGANQYGDNPKEFTLRPPLN